MFITGHTGFIGSWLSLWLHNLGANVTGYSKDIPSRPSLFERLNLKNDINHIFGDVNDLKSLKRCMNKSKPQFVFHLAAQPIVLTSYKDPLDTFQTNIMGTANILECLRSSSDVKASVIFTSDKCYENNDTIRYFKENDSLGGMDPYSASKGAAEIITSSFRRSFFEDKDHALGIATIRSGNVIGGGDWSKYRIIPDSIRSIISENPISIRNPNHVRPFQFVLEPLSAMLNLSVSLKQEPTKYSGSWNVGPNSKKMLTVKALVKEIIKNWGDGEFTISSKGKKEIESKILLLNSTKIKNHLRWHSSYSIEEGVKETVNWYKNNLEKENIKEFSIKQISDYYLISKQRKISWAQ